MAARKGAGRVRRVARIAAAVLACVLLLLVAASIGFCYLSVRRQWRPFLFSGLFYLAVAYYLAFSESVTRLADDPAAQDTARLVLTLGLIATGLVTMVVAWKLPARVVRPRRP